MWGKRRLAGWFALGLVASLLELGLLRGLVEVGRVPLPVATALAAEVLIIFKFLLNDRLVFNHHWPTVGRLMRYHGASAGALVVYWVVVNALSLVLGVVYVLAFVVGTAAAFGWSLLTNFLWVWDGVSSDARA
jgi:dolichol-phosphate mannosyltransferase